MLLRSITKHVRDQNWFAVALDFFIVVAGILIAFQINNWNEARQERSLEAQYLERLDTEFDVIRTRLSSGKDVLENAVRDIDLLLKIHRDYAENPDSPLPTDEVLISALSNASSGTVPAGSPAAFKEMVASGALGSLTSKELRQALFAYDEFSTITREAWKTIRAQHANATNGVTLLVDVAAPDDLDAGGNANIVEAKPIGFERTDFLESPEIRGYLAILLQAQINQYYLAGTQLTLAEDVEALLAQERN